MYERGYPMARERIAPAPFHPNESANLVETLRGRRASGTVGVTGAGGGNPQIQLFNPGDSAIEVLVDTVTVTTVAAQIVGVQLLRTPLATLTNNGFLLAPPFGLARAQVRTATDATTGAIPLEGASLLAASPHILNDLMVRLAPGDGLLVVGFTANSALQAAFRWREIPRNLLLFP